MKTIPILITILFSALGSPIAQAEKILADYTQLKEAEETSPAPLYYTQSTAPETAAALPTAPERALQAHPFADIFREVREAWTKRLLAMPTPILFVDFNTPEAHKARQLARSSDLGPTLAQPANLDLLLTIAFERNPMLASRRESWRLAAERLARAIYADNILGRYNPFLDPSEAKLDQAPTPATADSRSAPLFTLRADLTTKDILLEAKRFEIETRDMVTMMREAYYEYLYTTQAIRITKDNEELLKDFERTARKKYETGQAAFNDVIKAQVELSKLSQELITFQRNQSTFVARLNTLMNLPPEAPLGPPEEVTDIDVPLPLEQLYPLALKEQQGIHLLELQIEQMQLMTEAASKLRQPGTPPGVAIHERAEIPADELAKLQSFQPQAELRPRFWFGLEASPLSEALRQIDVMKEELREKKTAVDFEVKNSHFLLDAAKRQRDLYSTALLPQSKQSLESTRIAYLSGKSSFLDLLDAQRMWLDLGLMHQDFIREYRMNLAMLEKAIGKRFAKP